MTPLRILDDLGTQLQFYGRSFAWAPKTVRRYKREVVRLLAEVSFGSGGLAVVDRPGGEAAGLALQFQELG